MNTKMTFNLLVLCLAVVGALRPTSALAGNPLHEVRGHAVWDVVSQTDAINQISINAWEDETGVHGQVIWMTNYFWSPDLVGWTWVIDVDTLVVNGNSAIVAGTIVFDNKFSDDIGETWIFEVVDNGNGAADPPDELSGFAILGGNLIVK